ncbi:MAG: MFS transporter [Ktedonobacteraceae bacterium]
MLRNRTLLAVSLAVCAAYAGIGMVGPVRVLYAQSRGASLFIIGAMASGYLVSNSLFQYPWGWLADRWGRKQVMILGLFLQGILSLVYIPITDPVLFVVLRCVEGIMAAAVLPSARALIVDSVPQEQQGEAYGIFGAFFSAGFLIGPGIGGLLATIGYAYAFIGAALSRLIAIIIIILLVHPAKKIAVVSAGPAQAVPYRLLFTLPLLGAYILAFGDLLYVGFDQTILPIWMHNQLGASIATIGIAYVAFSLPNMILAPIGGRVADRRRRSWLILIAGLAQVPLYAIYGLTTVVIVVIFFFAVQGAVYAFIQPAVDASVAAASISTMRARVQGLYSTFGLIGGFFSASVMSLLYGIDYRLPLFAIGLGYGLCVLVGGLMIRKAEARALNLGKVL